MAAFGPPPGSTQRHPRRAQRQEGNPGPCIGTGEAEHLMAGPASLLPILHWTEEELRESGAIFDAQQLYNTIAILREGSGEEFLRQVFDLWVSKKATSEV
jgi:hypothetical protein